MRGGYLDDSLLGALRFRCFQTLTGASELTSLPLRLSYAIYLRGVLLGPRQAPN